MHRIKHDGDGSACRKLVEQFLWLVVSRAETLKRHSPGFFSDDLDAMVSDGMTVLHQRARAADPKFGLEGFIFNARRAIDEAIRRAAFARRPGGLTLNLAVAAVKTAVADFFTLHGRRPTEHELATILRPLGKDFAAYASVATLATLATRTTASLDSAFSDGDDRSLGDFVADKIHHPTERMEQKELIRIAMRGLEPIEKKILSAMLKGMAQIEIAEQMGTSRQRIGQRVNLILYKLQRNVDLAEYLGVEPLPMPDRVPYRNCFVKPAGAGGATAIRGTATIANRWPSGTATAAAATNRIGRPASHPQVRPRMMTVLRLHQARAAASSNPPPFFYLHTIRNRSPTARPAMKGPPMNKSIVASSRGLFQVSHFRDRRLSMSPMLFPGRRWSASAVPFSQSTWR